VGLEGSKVVWHTVIEAGSKTAVALSGLGSVASIGAGIWSVLTGKATLKGSGILSDRIRKTVLDIETHTLSSIRMYEQLLLKKQGRDARAFDMLKVRLRLVNAEHATSRLINVLVKGCFNCTLIYNNFSAFFTRVIVSRVRTRN